MRVLLSYAVFVIVASTVVGAGVWYFTPVEEASPAAESHAVASKAAVPKPLTPPRAADYRLPVGIDIKFSNRTRDAGIAFQHFDGRTEMEYIMDQTGSGVAWIDYDQDGLLDLYFVQGMTFVPPHPAQSPTSKLYRNLGGGRFQDVTEQVGLAHVGCGQGVAVGDIDNSGYPSLFLTCFGKPNVLYHNESDGHGGRRFVDVTSRAGLGDHPEWRERPNFSTSAAFLDFNHDGRLDLFVCSYVKIDLANYPSCFSKLGRRGPCPPAQFDGTHCLLYRNNGDGTFTDASQSAGIDQTVGKALGVVALDLDDDGLVDVFVANDTVPNSLFRNLGGGRFESLGPSSGCAVNLAGTPQAYMGVDADDLNGDGRPDLFVTAFSRETDTYFRNEGKCQFLDVTAGSGLSTPTWFSLAFGTCFLDVDRDGALDIAVVTGHVVRNVADEGDPNVTFRQTPQLFLNDGKARFHDLSRQAGLYFQEPHVGRGVACGDYDNDGHMDLVISNSGEAAALLHNDSKTPYHWVRLQLQGTKSNRDAVGARVTVYTGSRKLVRHRKGGGSYCSACDPRLLIGLGTSEKIDKIEVRWPGGAKEEIPGPLGVDQAYRIVEGSGRAATEGKR